MKLYHQNGCSNTSTQTITVNNPASAPIAKFDFSEVKNHCSPVNSTFINQSEHGSIYNWTIEMVETLDSSKVDFSPVLLTTFEQVSKSPSFTFTKPGTYKITLIARNTLDEVSQTHRFVSIYPDVYPLFVLRTAYPKLAQPVEFINVSKTGEVGGKYHWNFGEGEKPVAQDFQERSISHRYRSPSEYVVTLEAVNQYGCSNTFSDFVSVGSIPNNTSETLIYPNVFRPVPSEGQITTGTALTQDQMALANLVFLPVSMVLAREIKTYNLYIYLFIVYFFKSILLIFNDLRNHFQNSS